MHEKKMSPQPRGGRKIERFPQGGEVVILRKKGMEVLD